MVSIILEVLYDKNFDKRGNSLMHCYPILSYKVAEYKIYSIDWDDHTCMFNSG